MILIGFATFFLGLALGMIAGYDHARDKARARAETDAWRVAREQHERAALEAESERRLAVSQRVAESEQRVLGAIHQRRERGRAL